MIESNKASELVGLVVARANRYEKPGQAIVLQSFLQSILEKVEELEEGKKLLERELRIEGILHRC